MNKFTNQLIGAAIGGAFGYFVGAVIVEIINIKENENDWEDWIDGNENDPVEGQLGPKEPIIFMGHKKDKKIGKVKNYTQHFISEGRPELAVLAAKYNGELIEDAVVENTLDISEDFEVVEDEIQEEKDISIISLAEFTLNDDFKSLTLNFYDDDVVTDEHENPINRPDRILGTEFSVSFGILSEDEDVVYVKNLTKKAMYEIVRTNTTYAAATVAAAAAISPRVRKYVDEKKKKEEDNDGEDHT